MQIQNGTIYRSNPMKRMFGVGAINDIRVPMNQMGSLMGISFTLGENVSIPAGYYLGSAFVAPRKSGVLSSTNSANISINTIASGTKGLNGIGSTSISITSGAIGKLVVDLYGDAIAGITAQASIVGFADLTATADLIILASAIGGLLVSVSGDSSFTVTSDGIAVATINGSGTSSIIITSQALGQSIAIALGEANINIDSQATLVGSLGSEGLATITVSSSLLLDAIGWMVSGSNISVNGISIPYALGFMDGTTDVQDVITNQSIATEVWNSIAGDFNIPGSMGSKLNSASAAGDPWTAELPGLYPEGSAGFVISMIATILGNKMVTDPETGIMTIYDDNNNVLFTAQLYEDADGTQKYRGQGSERREKLS